MVNLPAEVDRVFELLLVTRYSLLVTFDPKYPSCPNLTLYGYSCPPGTYWITWEKAIAIDSKFTDLKPIEEQSHLCFF